MFESHEIEMLMEALDALERKGSDSALVSGMFSIVFAPPGKKDAALEESKREFEKIKQGKPALKESIILLKAKLIRMKDKALVEDVVNSL